MLPDYPELAGIMVREPMSAASAAVAAAATAAR
jgi:hypothetical protein